MNYEVKLGTACNNNCVFCLNSEREISLSHDRILNEIISAKSKGAEKITFTGGEPSIRTDFFELCSFVKSLGLGLQVQTNGRALSYFDFAEKACSIVDSFLISLHSNSEELNFKITGVHEGYSQTIEGIKNVRSFGKPVTLNIVVNNLNLPFLDKIAEHHAGLGIDCIQFSWVRFQGKVASGNGNIVPRYSEGITLLKKAIDAAVNNGLIVFVIGVPPCILGKHAKYSVNPHSDSFIIRDGNKINSSEWIVKSRKTMLAVCENCVSKLECGGVYSEYIRKFGDAEFRR